MTCTACGQPIQPGTGKFLLGSPYCSAGCLSQHYTDLETAAEEAGAEFVDLTPDPEPRADLTDITEPPTVPN